MFEDIGQIIIKDDYFQIVWDKPRGDKPLVDTFEYSSILSFRIIYPKWVHLHLLRNIAIFLLNVAASNPNFSTSVKLKMEIVFINSNVEKVELRFGSIKHAMLIEKSINAKLNNLSKK